MDKRHKQTVFQRRKNQKNSLQENSSRNFFSKIRETKGTIHKNIGKIKKRNATDLTEAEEIKKRCQEYTEEVYEKRSS